MPKIAVQSPSQVVHEPRRFLVVPEAHQRMVKIVQSVYGNTRQTLRDLVGSQKR